MKREASPPRPDFERHAEEIGFRFAGSGGEAYWDESARYVFSIREIEEHLESATQELHALCLDLVARVVASEELLARLRIPAHAWQLIQESWRRSDPTLYGRFDFSYDGQSPPKLLEYNADTPTSLIETAVAQWHWLEQMIDSGHLPKETDQFNSLHEKLIARFTEVSRRYGAAGERLFLACMSSHVEDLNTTEYLADCARSAGFEPTVLDMGDIGLENNLIFRNNFVDRKGRRVEWLFKLYPWEWMLADKFGAAPAMRWVRIFEPPWKMILSNKGMLALLWEMAPDHPNLAPCFSRTIRTLCRWAIAMRASLSTRVRGPIPNSSTERRITGVQRTDTEPKASSDRSSVFCRISTVAFPRSAAGLSEMRPPEWA